MATKSSIHIKPCNIASSEAHNRRTAEYMCNIGESRIYVVPELSTDNEQWTNPDLCPTNTSNCVKSDGSFVQDYLFSA